ncbi:MAG TPA: HAD family hydrolase [Candidatus Dormibacteraeota bacterium]|nr:HAD family hydrolase [Candidatus Dormibacteraeota bacterium]
MIRAIIFDFDGLIVDTEGPIFEAWRRIYRERGQELPRERWLTVIGTAAGPFDPILDLGERTGIAVDADELNTLERLYYREATVAQTLLPGVDRYMAEARRLGLKTAIASSSSRKWVHEHLERFAIRDRFDIVVCKDDVTTTKPDPELYELALERLDARSNEAIALEDSSNGIRAAKAAGLFCVAVPNALTAGLDLSQADLQIPSLEAVSLADLIARAQAP